MDEEEKIPKTILEEPPVMEMSRTEVGPQGENDPQNQTLAQKLKDHYNKGLKKNSRKLDNFLTPEVLNRTGVPMFLFTWVATLKIGVLDVMPLVYAGDDWIILGHQLVVLFIAIQMLINWLGIRYMTSSYISYKRRFGTEEAMKRDRSIFYQQISKHTADSSSAVLMPLVTDTNETGTASGKDKDVDKPQEIERDPACDLTQEAAKANQELHRRLDEETNGIQDLLSRSNDSDNKSIKTNQTQEIKVQSPTTVSPSSSGPKTVTYPYWSWTPCYQCVSTRPPRCHHCTICQACILKRDHHCYFAGSCVGYRNQRFFYIFLIWAWLGSMWATLHGFPYIYNYLWDDMSYVDVIFLFSIIRFIFGYISFQTTLSVTTLSLLIYFDTITTVFIYSNSLLIHWGVTSFERLYLKRSVSIKDSRSLRERIQAVFGKNWFLMFFIPIHFIVEPNEDPVNWPHIKLVKS